MFSPKLNIPLAAEKLERGQVPVLPGQPSPRKQSVEQAPSPDSKDEHGRALDRGLSPGGVRVGVTWIGF